MTHNSEFHHRRTIRLKNYNYSRAGAYFVTICTQDKECLFGDVVNGRMLLYEVGKAVRK
jgi:putative transposase